jgi:hypothetical protein
VRLRLAIVPLLIGVGAACVPPPECTPACKDLVEECGFDVDPAVCAAGCRSSPTVDAVRHDVRDCLLVADCGQVLAGECLGEPVCGGAGYYLVHAPGCFDGLRGVAVRADCSVVADDGDWGVIGPPYPVGDGSFAFEGVCTTSVDDPWFRSCTNIRGTCDYHLLPVL